MKYLVAVSGGIDSVVLLDKLAAEGEHSIIVAHFDHGIRLDSASDARFVEQLAQKYNFPFVGRREELGLRASEETARRSRYAFLREEAAAREAVIATAHHGDDVIETIAINIIRGTGWRGLAVLSASDVARPLLSLRKADIYDYARDKRLEWVEDSTNLSDIYLRNRLRRRLTILSSEQQDNILGLWQRQREVTPLIETEVRQLIGRDDTYSRHLFTHADEASTKELLRATIFYKSQTVPTRPQLDRALLAVKTARAGSIFEVGNKTSLHFTSRTFIVMTP